MSRPSKETSFDSIASTSQEGLEEEDPSLFDNRTLRVTLLSSEWGSSKGGLSTINRELAIQLAKHPNVEVSVYLPQCSEEDTRVASTKYNVQLIEAKRQPGFDPIDWLVSVPKSHAMDCVVGHGVHLGKQIQIIKQHHDCKWIQVVHTAPEELGMYKCYTDAISKGEKKHQTEVELCEMADQVVAVGPKLTDAFSRYLRSCEKHQEVLNLTPGIFTEFSEVKQATEERETFWVLVFGRGDSEDFKLKGYDIAAQAIAELNEKFGKPYQLMFVGAPEGKADEVRDKLVQSGISRDQLTVRCFNESREWLAKLLCEVDLAIMPSRTEGFGLTALEALSAGLPILVSGNSGLGNALKKVRYGYHHVVNSEDPKEWAKAIRNVRQKDRELRLEEASFLREEYAVKYSWEKQCNCLVEKMVNLTFEVERFLDPPLLYADKISLPDLEGAFGNGQSSTIKHKRIPSFYDTPVESCEGAFRSKRSLPKMHKRSQWYCNPFLADSNEGHYCRLVVESLEDEYIRRSNLIPLLWIKSIHLPLDDVYTRLEVKERRKVAFQLTNKEVHMYEIFSLGKEKEINKTFRNFLNSGEAIPLERQRARMVLVEGSPGIGKTTFCLKIANDWANKAIPKQYSFPEIQMMFLLKCRDMNGDVMQAIDDQLLTDDMTEKQKKELIDYISDLNNQENILIILDGLDELPQIAEQPLVRLLQRRVLSRCFILATSRQEKGIEVRQCYNFDSLLQINGFTIEDASEYVRKHFKNVDPDNCSKGERLIQAIQENTFLHALRDNPLNLLLLCVVFEDYVGNLPSSHTELYQIIFRCLLRRFCFKSDQELHCDDKALENQFKDSTVALGELAWRSLLEDRNYFLKEELDKLTNGNGMLAIKLGLVFMEASVKKLSPQHQYHFLHKTFQEFLAAAYLAYMLKDEINKEKREREVINIFEHFQLDRRNISGKYRQVFFFVAGLLGKDGAMFFKQLGQILKGDWKWNSPDGDCAFLIEILNESGAPDDLATVICPCIPLPKSLELSSNDWPCLRVLRYALEGSAVQSNLVPPQLINLRVTHAHSLSEHSASDLLCIVDNDKALQDLFISADDMTNLLANTMLKVLSSNSSISSLTLETLKSIFKFGGSCLILEQFNDCRSTWPCVVTSGLSGVTQLTSIYIKMYGPPHNVAVETLITLLLSNKSIISLSLLIDDSMEDSVATALSEGLLGETALEYLTVVVHGSLNNLAAVSLEKGFIENRTLHSLMLNVLGEVPENWVTVAGNILAANTSWKSLTLHPNVYGKFSNIPDLFHHPVSIDDVLQSLTISIWGELSILDAEAVCGHLLKHSSLSSFNLNVHGNISNGVADCLVKFFMANNVLPSFTINLWGEITSYGKTSLQRLDGESQIKFFKLKLPGLVTDDKECLDSLRMSGNFNPKSASRSVNITNTTQDELRETFLDNESLTELCLTVNIDSDWSEDWAYSLGQILAKSMLLTTFSLIVNNFDDSWGQHVGKGLAASKSLTTFSLTVHDYAVPSRAWGYDVGNGVAKSKSLTTFRLTVHSYTDRSAAWGGKMGHGLAVSKSLIKFSVTVHNYAGMAEDWGDSLKTGLAKSKSLIEFSLTVNNYADAMEHCLTSLLRNGVAESKSLSAFSLTVNNYADTTVDWVHSLDCSLAKSRSLATIRVAVNNHSKTSKDLGCILCKHLAEIKSLTSLNVSVSLYGEDHVC